MKFELFLTDRARADILRNAEWWAENHSPDQSIVWFDLFAARTPPNNAGAISFRTGEQPVRN